MIDLDEVSFADGDLHFALAEIELMVSAQKDATAAADKILEFAQAHGLDEEPLLGKVGFYLKAKKQQIRPKGMHISLRIFILHQPVPERMHMRQVTPLHL